MDGSSQSVAGDLGSCERMQMAAVTHQRESPLAEHMCEAQGTGLVERRCACGEAFKELTLLLPNRQLEGLEKVASTLGVATGQLLRHLIGNWLAALDGALSPEDRALLDAEAEVRSATQADAGAMRTKDGKNELSMRLSMVRKLGSQETQKVTGSFQEERTP